MLTTCPRCGTRSSATSESCGDCGHDLYRVAYPTPSAALRLTFRNRVPARLTVSVALALVGAGVAAGVLLAGGNDPEPISKNRPPASAVPREPTPSPPPPTSSPEPTKTKAPPKPAPATTQPTRTPSAAPSPSRTYRDPFEGIRDAQRALEFADEVKRQWTGEGLGERHWNRR
ncbi:hypothetical protein [Streptomyces sp. WMMB 322]|uniref:hypothetical protein n=1 Tax=Streptomyces sp. WMMB 322 TaxID=1286821 RepID=UPI0008239302|nr:hypothetical protein [Streptomyces sp. WMMB 322]SCK19455.1 hypothetical protein H180DRAFT_01387 [Streptomyces sp. WMMB 322]